MRAVLIKKRKNQEIQEFSPDDFIVDENTPKKRRKKTTQRIKKRIAKRKITFSDESNSSSNSSEVDFQIDNSFYRNRKSNRLGTIEKIKLKSFYLQIYNSLT